MLTFIRDEMKIPVLDFGLGEIRTRDVNMVMDQSEYALVLGLDVAVNKEILTYANENDVQIVAADVIYFLQDQLTTYIEKCRERKKQESEPYAVFPVVLQIHTQCIFRGRDPVILGCDVLQGQLRV